MFIIFYILIFLASALVLYYRRVFKYWTKRGVATHNVIIPFGNASGLRRTISFGEQWRNLYNQFRSQGLPYGGAYLFSTPFFIPTDPELVKSIMQKDFQHFMNHGNYINEKADPLSGHLFSLENEKWRNMRVKLTPTFTSGKMKMMFDTLANCTEGLVDNINKNASDSTPVDIKEVLGCFSTDVIGSCAFGIECNTQKNPDSEFRKYGKMVFQPDVMVRLKGMMISMLPKSLIFKLNLKLTRPEVEDFFMKMVKKTVDYREKNNVFRKDFMHLLIQLKNMGKVTDDDKITDENNAESGLTMNELTAQAFVFFLAGFETSSTTSTFALYELALNPEVQRKAREEVREVLKKHNGKLTYEAVMELQYMEKIINEALRKYPPIPVIFRQCTKDYKVPDTDLVIEKGVRVAISALGLHYDHKYYPNPTAFDPERFSEENKTTRPAFTWLPFGEGPRMCIGLRFGMMQTKVGLATLINNFEISLNRKTSVPITLEKYSFISSVEGGIWLDFKKISTE